MNLGLPPKLVMEKGGYTPIIKEMAKLEDALASIKSTFENKLKKGVGLMRVSCPLFVDKRSGFNDINGVDRPASFSPGNFEKLEFELPQSLAKWKCWALQYYNLPEDQGLVVDFRGLRRDENVDYTHSLYVDQFDWEKRIAPKSRNVETLRSTVNDIYKALRETEQEIANKFGFDPILPQNVHFASTDAMIAAYPNASPKEHENILCERYGAVFLIGIGGHTPDGGLRHDRRNPDSDDWTTPRPDGGAGLNGDLLVWHPVLKESFELSSMGIRVDRDVMDKQLKLCNVEDRKEQAWHKMLMDGTIPASIGGGIGQSRLCQFILRTAHIGEVQYGWYPPKAVELCRQQGIHLLGLGTDAGMPLGF